MTIKTKKPLAVALGAAFLATSIAPVATADVNPFAANPLSSGYDLANFGKHGEGNCGGAKKANKEGKCGEAKCGADKKASMEGKCGEGKKVGKEGKCGADKKAGMEGKCGGDKKADREGKCGGDK